MKVSELRTQSIDELHKQLAATRKTLIENKRSLAAGELPNPRVVGKTRREIATIMTVLTEKTTLSKSSETDETQKGNA